MKINVDSTWSNQNTTLKVGAQLKFFRESISLPLLRSSSPLLSLHLCLSPPWSLAPLASAIPLLAHCFVLLNDLAQTSYPYVHPPGLHYLGSMASFIGCADVSTLLLCFCIVLQLLSTLPFLSDHGRARHWEFYGYDPSSKIRTNPN